MSLTLLFVALLLVGFVVGWLAKEESGRQHLTQAELFVALEMADDYCGVHSRPTVAAYHRVRDIREDLYKYMSSGDPEDVSKEVWEIILKVKGEPF